MPVSLSPGTTPSIKFRFGCNIPPAILTCQRIAGVGGPSPFVRPRYEASRFLQPIYSIWLSSAPGGVVGYCVGGKNAILVVISPLTHKPNAD
jgi:hypothetical protein